MRMDLALIADIWYQQIDLGFFHLVQHNEELLGPGTRDSFTVAEALLYIIAIKFTASCIVMASFLKV
jgi:hypothetical protein